MTAAGRSREAGNTLYASFSLSMVFLGIDMKEITVGRKEAAFPTHVCRRGKPCVWILACGHAKNMKLGERRLRRLSKTKTGHTWECRDGLR